MKYEIYSNDMNKIYAGDGAKDALKSVIEYLLSKNNTLESIKQYGNRILLTSDEYQEKIQNSSINEERKKKALDLFQQKEKVQGIGHGALRYTYLDGDLWVQDGITHEDLSKILQNIAKDGLVNINDLDNISIDFADITRDDIFKAMEKYKQLEKDQKLEASRAARKYTLFWESNEYPHKYIVGIAYGIHYNLEILDSSLYHATGNDKKSAEWCLNMLGFELFADAKFKQYLEENYPNETTKSTYYNDLRKAIKILQKIDHLKDSKLSKIFEYVLNGNMNFEEYDKAQQQLGYNDKQLSTTLASKIRVYLKSIEENNTDKSDQGEEMSNISKQPLNQILYGPPGTGKTYNTINKALEIIFEKEDVDKQIQHKFQDYDVNKLVSEIIIILRQKSHTSDDRKVLMTIFDYYKSQIVFTTFHQSYGYEEFIEGIKAIPAGEKGNKSNDMVYKVVDGLFKSLANKSIENVLISKIDENINQNYEEISESPTIWKISLGEGGEIKKECFDNNVIRIGWDQYGDLNKVNSINQRELKDFYNLENGDVVLSFKNQWEIDGIGVVVGEYFFNDNHDHYKHEREVKWIIKNKTISIKSYNDEVRMTLSSLYKLYRISKTNILEILESNEPNILNVEKRNQNYVLIIDEINRGNISKIFGELITLIEDSKRLGSDESIEAILPYSNEKFGVPSNLYIIGTMNTADRSIALMDTALRRRFTFIEMMPDSVALQQAIGSIISLGDDHNINPIKLLETINKRIEFLYDRDHQIGHAYFMSLKGKDGDKAFVELDNIFRNKIIPLLQEYFYDDWEKIQIVLGDHYDQINGNKTSSNNDEKDLDSGVNSYRFIQSFKADEVSIVGFNHDDIEDEQRKYRINPTKTFPKEAYMGIIDFAKKKLVSVKEENEPK